MTIRYKKTLLTINEIWFDHNIQENGKKSDITIYYNISKPPEKPGKEVLVYDAMTLITDLTHSEEEIMGRIGKNAREKIRKMEKKDYYIEVFDSQAIKNDLSILEDYVKTYNEFIQSRNLSSRYYCKRHILNAYVDSGLLFITCFNYQGRRMVYHSYMGDGTITRGLKSFSLFRNTMDTNLRQLISMGNCLLVWKGLMFFKKKGYEIFDWGGYADLPELQGVNKFKEQFGGVKVRLYNYYVPHSWLGKAAMVYIRRKEQTGMPQGDISSGQPGGSNEQ